MLTYRFQTTVDRDRAIALTLPVGAPEGPAEVAVTFREPLATPGRLAADEALARILRFGDGTTLGGLSIREMAAEGRR